jgi:NADPH:quinone reductase-like Zn-dependent oxidoreductase
MKAIVHDRYGPPDVLELRAVDRPVIKDDEVLVRVRAAAVNFGDWAIMRGWPYVLRLASGLRGPRVMVRGRDVAGRVEAVGAAVTHLRPGDEVYAETATGSFAEYARVPERVVAPKPAALTFEQAAAVPVAATAALQCLRDGGRVGPGMSVLINGASGGVGTFAVQIAKAFGADVTGVCSARNAELVRSLGADHVIDYARVDFTRAEPRYDVIVDLVGNHSLASCRQALKPRGVLVLSSGGGNRWFGPIGRLLRAIVVSPFVRQRLRPVAARRSRDDLEAITALIESGAVSPTIDRTYPLSDVAEAVRYFEEEHARAKIVITV